MLTSLRAPCPFKSHASHHTHRRQCIRTTPSASLDSSSAFAIAQQGVMFAAVVGGEAAFTGLTKEKPQGKPELIPTLAGVGGSLVAALLLQVDAVQVVGAIFGLGVAGVMMGVYIKRFQQTEYDPLDWPGAKTWPAVMCLVSFFALAAFAQGLRAEF